jgi:hypothetical protein
MKIIMYISIVALVAGCASKEASVCRWNDMRVDIALRHKFEKYSCTHALEGYSKDPLAFSRHRSVRKREQAVLVKAPQSGSKPDEEGKSRTEDSIRALSARIEVLEQAMKTNASTTNQNQDLIVQQINVLKAQLAGMQQARMSEK